MRKDLKVKYNFDIFLLLSVGIKNTFFTLDIFIERNYVVSAKLVYSIDVKITHIYSRRIL